MTSRHLALCEQFGVKRWWPLEQRIVRANRTLTLGSTICLGQEGKTWPTERSALTKRFFVEIRAQNEGNLASCSSPTNKVLRFEHVGLISSRPVRTNRNSHGFLAASGNPHGFLAMGDVMIRMLNMAAWACGERMANPTPV